MKSLRHPQMHRATRLEAAFGLSVLVAACTSATPDYTPIAPSGTTSGSAGGVTGAASGSTTGTSGSGAGDATGTGVSGGGVTGSTTGTASGTTTGAASGGTTGTASGASTGTASGDTTGDTSGASTGTVSGASTGTASGDTSGASTGTVSGASTGTASGASTGAASGASTGTASGATSGSDAGAGGGCYWVQDATTGLWSFDATAPGKIVLFDGTAATYAMWHKENQPTVPIQWTLNADGTMTVVPSGTGQATEIQSDMKFDNLCVHVEYQTPHYDSSVTGQLRGNSGVYLKSAYEMQILDSFGQPPDINTCGAAYSIAKPLVVACLDNTPTPPPWNIYEIEFKSSVWNNATPPVKTGNAEFLKCALNGQVVQLNTVENPPNGYTQAGVPDAPGPQPLGLQDHLDLVSFRNVWVRIPQY